jgi:hypothetical protein
MNTGKARKEGKPHGKNPPSKYNASKMKNERKRQLLRNFVLHSNLITQNVELLLNESLGEDVDSLFRCRTVLQINDLVMNQLFDVMHMDLDVFFPLSLYRISAKFERALVVTPDDSRAMELDTKLSEEVL